METTPNTQTGPVWADAKKLRKAVKTLNAHHLAHGAGFYHSNSSGRYFKARATAGVLEVSDFDTWTALSEGQAVFHDHNGHSISL